MKKFLNLLLFAIIAFAMFGTTSYFAYNAHPITIVVGPVPAVVYSVDFHRDIGEDDALFHIGNYSPETIQRMVAAAEKANAKYYVTAPYSEACSLPNAICEYDSDMAFHLEHSKSQEFWHIYCTNNKSDVMCKYNE